MRRRPLTALVALVAVAGTSAAVLVLIATSGGDDAPGPTGSTVADEPAPTPTTTGGTSAATTTSSTGTGSGAGPSMTGGATTADVPPEVAEIMAFVSDERGLPFLEPVPVDFLDDDGFEALLRELQAEDLAAGAAEERELTGQLWQALDLIDDGDDLFGLVDRIGIEAALGFYEFDEQRMVVRGDELTPLIRVTLAHELTHALDDQHFGLDRPELEESEGEEAFAFLVLSEGSAERVAEQYQTALPAGDRDDLADETLEFGAAMDLGDVPIELLLIVQLPYLVGPELVEAVLDAGGRDRLDAAFVDPPVTSEEVLEPSAYLEGELVRPVDTPSADGDATDQGVFGAAGLFVLFPGGTGLDLAERWGGDRYVQWLDEDGRACVRVDLLGDDAADSDLYADALSGWAAEHGDAEVERDGETVRLTACA